MSFLKLLKEAFYTVEPLACQHVNKVFFDEYINESDLLRSFLQEKGYAFTETSSATESEQFRERLTAFEIQYKNTSVTLSTLEPESEETFEEDLRKACRSNYDAYELRIMMRSRYESQRLFYCEHCEEIFPENAAELYDRYSKRLDREVDDLRIHDLKKKASLAFSDYKKKKKLSSMIKASLGTGVTEEEESKLIEALEGPRESERSRRF